MKSKFIVTRFSLLIICLPLIIQGNFTTTELTKTEISNSNSELSFLPGDIYFSKEKDLVKQQIYLQCNATKVSPDMTVDWFKDYRNLKYTPGYIIDIQYNNKTRFIHSTLRIDENTDVFPSGSYSCKVGIVMQDPLTIEYKINNLCEYDFDCGKSMECNNRGQCGCQIGFVMFQTMCFPMVGYGEDCRISDQCKDDNSHCETFSIRSKCRCNLGFSPVQYMGSIYCHPIRPNVPITNLNKDVYKAAIVALSCFVVTVFGLIALFLCNRRFITRRDTIETIDTNFTDHRGSNFSSQRGSDLSNFPVNDIFNVSEGLAAMRMVDKPPTYQEVVVQDQTIRGVPPPAYSDAVQVNNTTERAASIMATMVINSQIREMILTNGIRLNQQSSSQSNGTSDRPSSSGGVTNNGFVSET